MPARCSWRRSVSRLQPTVAEPRRLGSQPGWRAVVLVAGTVVALVLGAAILTSFLPESFQEIVFRTPVAIAALVLGTGWLLWRISRRDPGAPEP